MRLLPILALTALAAAGPDEGRRLRPDHAPTPFTAAEIRAGCPEGRETTFVVEQPGQPAVRQVTRFTRGDAEGTDYEVLRIGPGGKPLGAPRVTYSTWKKLQEHASYPAAATQVTEETVTVPAGEFECVRYTVSTGNAVRKFWFAKDLPGPPVKVVAEAGGRTFTMTLEANRPFDFARWLGPQELAVDGKTADVEVALEVRKGRDLAAPGLATTLFGGEVTPGVVVQVASDGLYVHARAAAGVEGALRVTKGPLKGALVPIRGERSLFSLPRGARIPTGALAFEIVALVKSG